MESTNEYSPNYPRMIYKGKENKIVDNPFDHASWIDQGWSGPAIFGKNLADMRKEVEQRRAELVKAEEKLAMMEKASEEHDPDNGVGASSTVPTCSICHKTFKTEEGLIGHMSKHRDGKE